MKLTLAAIAVALLAATSASAGIFASGALNARDIADGVPAGHSGKFMGFITKNGMDGRDEADYAGMHVKRYEFKHSSAAQIASMPVSR